MSLGERNRLTDTHCTRYQHDKGTIAPVEYDTSRLALKGNGLSRRRDAHRKRKNTVHCCTLVHRTTTADELKSSAASDRQRCSLLAALYQPVPSKHTDIWVERFHRRVPACVPRNDAQKMYGFVLAFHVNRLNKGAKGGPNYAVPVHDAKTATLMGK